MALTYIKTESEEEWHALRAKDVTSTESAALFGLSPYVTELELFHRKKAEAVVDIGDNQRMKAGRFLEPSIAKLAGDELDARVLPFKRYATDPDSRMGSSFDWRITTGDLAKWILEIKNVDFLVWRDQWVDDEAPEHIEVQVQHQLELTKRPGAVIAALVGGNDLKLILRERDPKMGAAIRARIERFWDDVANDREPEPNWERDADYIIAMATKDGGEAYKADGDESTMLLQSIQAQKEIADLEAFRRVIQAKLLRAAGDANQIIGDGVKVSCKMTKPTKPTLITEDMVGTEIGGRAGFRNFRITRSST